MKIDRASNTRVDLMRIIATTTTTMMTTMILLLLMVIIKMRIVRARTSLLIMVINQGGAVLPTPTPPLISSWEVSRMMRETLMTMIAKKVTEVEGKVVV